MTEPSDSMLDWTKLYDVCVIYDFHWSTAWNASKVWCHTRYVPPEPYLLGEYVGSWTYDFEFSQIRILSDTLKSTCLLPVIGSSDLRVHIAGQLRKFSSPLILPLGDYGYCGVCGLFKGFDLKYERGSLSWGGHDNALESSKKVAAIQANGYSGLTPPCFLEKHDCEQVLKYELKSVRDLDKEVQDLNKKKETLIREIEKLDVKLRIKKSQSPSKYRNRRDRKLYIMYDPPTDLYKLGISNNPGVREETLAGVQPAIKLLATTDGSFDDERSLHMRFSSKRVRGEWFALTRKDLEYLRSNVFHSLQL